MKAKSRETESRVVAARAGQRGEGGFLMGMEL